jgi:hypothetical protein
MNGGAKMKTAPALMIRLACRGGNRGPMNGLFSRCRRKNCALPQRRSSIARACMGKAAMRRNILPHATFVEFFPLGLRYHALHHLFPSLPYHALGTAHRRLIVALPPDSAPPSDDPTHVVFRLAAVVVGSAGRKVGEGREVRG